MVVQLCQGDGGCSCGGAGFVESSRGRRGAGVSYVNISIRHICGWPSAMPEGRPREGQKCKQTDREGAAAERVREVRDEHVVRAGC
jgi:hypothetical protein